jgi:hypothetical protein
MVVLYEATWDAVLAKQVLIIGFNKKSPVVREPLWNDKDDVTQSILR